ncbi:hypothetical protein [Alkalihalobacillus sp. AL-G]|uniref:hypothetical protein n=1 Tax=Alkalihalobacillus sp. AL-G TaxID=2926399 RepID=UPI00272ABC79|nr:hypothetical protein [Alkalihalobacillus sp. AL-G]WLD94736.1 hypothetical protein MOJ78_07595 [Alkalihalobacillus sp. AL-G]
MDRNEAVHYGGNSDVDVQVNVDTSALAYAYACFMNASGQLSDTQFEEMLIKLDKLLGDERGVNYLSNDSNAQNHPQLNEKVRVLQPQQRKRNVKNPDKPNPFDFFRKPAAFNHKSRRG